MRSQSQVALASANRKRKASSDVPAGRGPLEAFFPGERVQQLMNIAQLNHEEARALLSRCRSRSVREALDLHYSAPASVDPIERRCAPVVEPRIDVVVPPGAPGVFPTFARRVSLPPPASTTLPMFGRPTFRCRLCGCENESALCCEMVLCPLHEENLRAAAFRYEATYRKLRERQLGAYPELGVYLEEAPGARAGLYDPVCVEDRLAWTAQLRALRPAAAAYLLHAGTLLPTARVTAAALVLNADSENFPREHIWFVANIQSGCPRACSSRYHSDCWSRELAADEPAEGGGALLQFSLLRETWPAISRMESVPVLFEVVKNAHYRRRTATARPKTCLHGLHIVPLEAGVGELVRPQAWPIDPIRKVQTGSPCVVTVTLFSTPATYSASHQSTRRADQARTTMAT